jgi:hypothetical protein
MDKVTQLVRSQLMNVKKNLEQILDHSQWTDDQFEPSKDYQSLQLSLSKLPKDNTEKILASFASVSTFFMAGLLVYKKNQIQTQIQNQNNWDVGSAFKNGHIYSLEGLTKTNTVVLPNMKTGELRKTTPYTLLSSLGLCHWSDGTESSAFVLKLHENFVGLFFIDLPEPWLRLHIEQVYKALSNSLELTHGK